MRMRRHRRRQARLSYTTISIGRLPVWYWDLSSVAEVFDATKCMFRELDQLLEKMDDYAKKWFQDWGRA